MDYVNAFWVGGLICALVQILLEKTTLLPGRIMVLLVVAGSVLGAVGYTLWKGVKEAVDESGFLGLFQGGFRASAVGISAALIFSYLASLVFEPKMKDGK